MYEENGGFDERSSSLHGGGGGGGGAFSQTHLPNNSNNFSTEDHSYPQNDVAAAIAAASALEMELQHHLEIEQCFNGENGHYNYHQQQHIPAADNFNQIYAAAASSMPDAADLLNMFPLPSSLLPKLPAFLACEPLLPLNQPPLFHSSPHVESSNGTLFMDERERNVDGVFEFTAKNRDGIKDTKHLPTEKHRRAIVTEKYDALKSLLPSPTKKDRASILADATSYINELKRTVTELKILVENKRCARERLKRPTLQEECVGDMDPYNGSSLRSSWLHRKSNNTEVDVRIIDDEVTVKLVQQKRINCLLFVSKVLDELQLDLHHVAGGLIGDYYSYLFNSKICEGSIVYASAVANKVIEIVDKQYDAVPPTATY